MFPSTAAKPVVPKTDVAFIVLCGRISQLGLKEEEMYGLKQSHQIIVRSLTVYGFIVTDKRFSKHMSSFVAKMPTWILEGKIKTKEEITVGIDNAPAALINMLKGDKFGKAVVKVAEGD
jgi:NADPH-dependent curcumin reductase CurA